MNKITAFLVCGALCAGVILFAHTVSAKSPAATSKDCVKAAQTKKAKSLREASRAFAVAKKKAGKDKTAATKVLQQKEKAEMRARQVFTQERAACTKAANVIGKSRIEAQEKKSSFVSPRKENLALPLAEKPNLQEGMPGLCGTNDECSTICTEQIGHCIKYCRDETHKENSFCIQMDSMAKSQGMSLDMMANIPSFMLTPMIKQVMSGMKGGEMANFNTAQALPALATKNFIDLDRIARISKFRGGYGHDYSLGTGESCRSMKHYFWPSGGEPASTHSPSWTTIGLYAPADGTVARLQKSGGEAQFALHSKANPAFSFIFHHVVLLPGIVEDAKVAAGEKLGTVASDYNYGEIGVEVMTTRGRSLVSFFEVADESVIAQYKNRGLSSIKDVIISQESRDAHPLICDPGTTEGRFIGVSIDGFTDSSGLSNWHQLVK